MQAPIKILQIIPSLASGGAERFVVDLCNELINQSVEVHLCIVQDPDVKDYGFYRAELSNQVHFHSLYQSKGFSFGRLS